MKYLTPAELERFAEMDRSPDRTLAHVTDSDERFGLMWDRYPREAIQLEGTEITVDGPRLHFTFHCDCAVETRAFATDRQVLQMKHSLLEEANNCVRGKDRIAGGPKLPAPRINPY
jgi:hypothetical protein